MPVWAREFFTSSATWIEFRDLVRAALPRIDSTAELAENEGAILLQIGGSPMTVLLTDVAQHCCDSGETARMIDAWTDVAAGWAQEMHAQAAMTWDEVAPSLRVQLYNDERHSAMPMMIARRVAEDLWLALVADTDLAVTTLTDALVAPWRQSEDMLFERAIANVLNAVDVTPSSARVPLPLQICSSGDIYTAVAGYLALDELVGETSHGALVMFPTRYTVSYLPIDGAVPATPYQVMVSGGRHNFNTGEGPLSSSLYWWRDGELSSVPMLAVGEALVAIWPDALTPMMRAAD